MELIKSLTFYDIVYCKYVQKYWIIHRDNDVLEGDGKSLPEALALGEALNNSLKQFIIEDKD